MKKGVHTKVGRKHDDPGAKFCTIVIGPENSQTSILVNLNCTVNILLDHIKRTMIAKTQLKLKELKEEEQNIISSGSIENSNMKDIESYMNVYNDIAGHLAVENVVIDLHDLSNISTNCLEVKRTYF
jgi:hypothetical protein